MKLKVTPSLFVLNTQSKINSCNYKTQYTLDYLTANAIGNILSSYTQRQNILGILTKLRIKLGQEGALRNFLSRLVCAAVLIQSIEPHVIRKWQCPQNIFVTVFKGVVFPWYTSSLKSRFCSTFYFLVNDIFYLQIFLEMSASLLYSTSLFLSSSYTLKGFFSCSKPPPHVYISWFIYLLLLLLTTALVCH